MWSKFWTLLGIATVIMVILSFTIERKPPARIPQPPLAGYTKVCVDGQVYIRFEGSLTNKLGDDGRPVECTVEEK